MAGSLAARVVEWDTFPFPEPWFFHPPHFARLLKDRWGQICREAAAERKVEELHAARGSVLSVFDRLIAFHKSYLALLDLQEELTGRNGHPRWPRQELVRATEELVGLRDEIFSRWQTRDDLYQILIEKFTPSAERQKDLAAKYPPPQSWYEETDDPFSAE
jgi:hypothetical protein